MVKALKELVKSGQVQAGKVLRIETTLNKFNSAFADEESFYKPLDLEAIRNNAYQETSRVLAYIVDMAKAEALDCLGEREAGVKLVEKYV